MMVNSVHDLLADAMFVSDLQPSQPVSAAVVHSAVTRMILRYGSDGCAEGVASEFGDHPDMAVRRMGWVRRTLHSVYPTFTAQPAF
jgi:hypothetical protein